MAVTDGGDAVLVAVVVDEDVAVAACVSLWTVAVSKAVADEIAAPRPRAIRERTESIV